MAKVSDRVRDINGNEMANELTQDRPYDQIELAALSPGGTMVRNQYARKNDLDKIDSWRRRFSNTNIFSSIDFLREPDSNSASISPWYFDLDCPSDLAAAGESTLMLCEMLMDRTGVFQEHLDISFSGAKGFHVVVAPEIFRAFHSPYTLDLYRRMAQRARDAGVRFIDESVYSRRRLWRLVNSKHGKSGLFKIPLTYEELRDISIDGIRALAANPRPDDTLARHSVCEDAADWYRRAIAAVTELKARSSPMPATSPFKQGWRMPPCIKAIQEATLPDGVRHPTYLSLTRFYRWIGMHPDEIRERIEALDSRNPIRDLDYIERTVGWGCRHPCFPGCGDGSLRRYCHPDNCFYVRIKKNAAGR